MQPASPAGATSSPNLPGASESGAAVARDLALALRYVDWSQVLSWEWIALYWPVVLFLLSLVVGVPAQLVQSGLLASSDGDATGSAVETAARTAELARGLGFFAGGVLIGRPGVKSLVFDGPSVAAVFLTLFGAPFVTFGCYSVVSSLAGVYRPDAADDRRVVARVPGLHRVYEVAYPLAGILALVAGAWLFARGYADHVAPGATVLGLPVTTLIDGLAASVALLAVAFVLRNPEDVGETEGGSADLRELFR